MRAITTRIEGKATIVEAGLANREGRGGECSPGGERRTSKSKRVQFYLSQYSKNIMERSNVREPGILRKCTLHAPCGPPARSGESEAERIC